MRIAEIRSMVTPPAQTLTWADDSQREVIIGRTGSGKTIYGLWRLSYRSFDQMPWIIFDYKGDKAIREIDAEEIDFRHAPPKRPGLYVARPLPKIDDEQVNGFLWKIWRQGRVGLYFDEGYMIPAKGALEGIMTQGRSLEVPTITLVQRPVWIEKFVFSEADYYTVFNLNRKIDRLKVREEVTDRIPANYRLPSFNSYYYDVGQDTLMRFQPVPDRDVILQQFENRLHSGRKKRRAL